MNRREFMLCIGGAVVTARSLPDPMSTIVGANGSRFEFLGSTSEAERIKSTERIDLMVAERLADGWKVVPTFVDGRVADLSLVRA